MWGGKIYQRKNMGPAGNWLPIYWMSNLAHFSLKIQELLLVYLLINNAIRKITYLFILRLNNFFRFHVFNYTQVYEIYRDI